MLSIVIAATIAFQSSPSILGCMPNSGRTPPTPVVTEAMVTIGGEDDTPLFRISGAALFENLTLAVSNAGTNEIFLFDPDGSFKMRLGGHGGGPSEFRRLGPVHWMEGDRLAATGRDLQKVVVINPQDGFVTSYPLRGPMIQAVFPLPRGQWLAHSLTASVQEPKNGRFNMEGRIAVHDSDGRMQRILDITPTVELFDLETPSGGRARGVPPFPKGTYVDVDHTGCVWIATDVDAKVEVYDLSGRRLGEFSLRDHVPLELTRGEWDEEIERMAQRSKSPSGRQSSRQLLEGLPFDPRRPAFSGMKLDDAGRAWLTPYHKSGTDVDGWWVVAGFAIEPIWVPAPPGTRSLLEVRFDHAVLLHADSLGVATLTVHPLRYE